MRFFTVGTNNTVQYNVGVHIKRLFLEWGSTVLYFKIIIVGVVLQLLA